MSLEEALGPKVTGIDLWTLESYDPILSQWAAPWLSDLSIFTYLMRFLKDHPKVLPVFDIDIPTDLVLRFAYNEETDEAEVVWPKLNVDFKVNGIIVKYRRPKFLSKLSEIAQQYNGGDDNIGLFNYKTKTEIYSSYDPDNDASPDYID
ncbi:hypothetical protein DTO271G3_2114 [Paecilomyces variotii]|nr:hypothetical protein DTO271G3_2114 [Paecilomyces variotii]